ncbi:hypothetical protein [Nocardioides humi]|uniref:Neocarzinostatin family protein n=1 Tax=Nocardioides humi TaxID=449461 RepID=A0ABN2BMU8_9ACTN|nr:hypothetical protein [Nocardioides humi]
MTPLAGVLLAGVLLHPFGDPQTLQVGRDGDVVQVVWRAGAADDLTLLGIDLGVLPGDRVRADGTIAYEFSDGRKVAASAALPGYLLEHIAVVADGVACPGAVSEVGNLVTQGAVLRFTCPTAPAAAELTVSTLTDIDPAYRTLATGPDGQRAVYASSDPTRRWSLAEGTAPGLGSPAGGATATTSADRDTGYDGAGLGRSAVLQMGALVGGPLVLVLAGLLRRRRRRQAQPATGRSLRKAHSSTVGIGRWSSSGARRNPADR